MEKLHIRQTKDRIADMLRKEILSGRIADGEELAQEQLAEILQVSRMPIREALQTLEAEGLLLRLPNRHMSVIGICRRTAYENMRVIAAVEAETAILLMESGVRLSDLNIKSDRKFHLWFSERLDNPYISKMHSRLIFGYVQYAWEVCKDPGRLSTINENIKHAFNSGDAIALRKNILEYYSCLAEALLANIKENAHE